MSRVLAITNPGWLAALVDEGVSCATVEDRMRFAVRIAVENVEREKGKGGPFGAAVFEVASGRLLAAGVNSVLRLENSVLHAEVLAIMTAQAAKKRHTLKDIEGEAFELVTSCEPCAMCLGATLWSGVKRLVYGATRDDAEAVGFDEGPVFPESYDYLRDRGVEIVGEVCRREANAPFERYQALGGQVY